MRIVAFNHNGVTRYGARYGDRVVVHPSATSAMDIALDTAAHPPGEEVALSSITLQAPILRPGKTICIGLNYRAHAIEGGNAIPDYPAVFLRGPTSLLGPGEPMIFPEVSEQLDYEAELGVVIGRKATAVSIDDALDHVAGYTCFNDGSVRDYQRLSAQWTVGKNFDGTGAFGPELVTPEELPAGASGLRIIARLNGRIMQDSNTADMIFGVAKLVSLLSEAMTLEPGDVIATGTPSGVGYARKPPIFMIPGDVIEIEIEDIGILSNIVARRTT